eukprot:Opistho-2@29134
MTEITTAATRGRELTLRAILLGGVLTLMFTAANVYLGLKVGLTFATSIPAAVISMALLRYMAGSTILENNIVQTIASAAGTLAAIIFVLPGLVMVGYWQGFPLLETIAITMLGGILGVLFSVPLRRALVVDSDLPYPEGRAAAEVLQVGAASAEGAEENKAGLSALLWNSIVAAAFTLLTQMKLVGAEVARWFSVGTGATGIAGGLGFALFGVGHLVGLSVGMAQLVGLITGWWVLLPILTQGGLGGGVGDAETLANTVFRADVRFFWRRSDRGRGDLDPGQDCRTSAWRHPFGDGGQPRTARRRHDGGRRTGYVDQLGVRRFAGADGADRLAALVSARGRTARGIVDDPRRGRDPVHYRGRADDRVGDRLYGRPDRRVELAGVGDRHPRDHCVVAFAARPARPRRR